MAALRITQDVVVNIREGVRTQIGKCAYLSQAYNLSVHVVCDKIVYSMNIEFTRIFEGKRWGAATGEQTGVATESDAPSHLAVRL
ncbi:hypothetical protein HPB50_015472 [Hyalomma asiaticum]|uniref:Uncharacterized protein n=1 Tax=Hyalomma asiaticum TaxID=266040 RepID=A0ACB7S0Y3_HYAAI|nr:hypothetical protein HPB50_015472 [Hyalomma asiaticum]